MALYNYKPRTVARPMGTTPVEPVNTNLRTSPDVMESRIGYGMPASPLTTTQGTQDPYGDLTTGYGDWGANVVFPSSGSGLTAAQKEALKATKTGASNQSKYLLDLLTKTPQDYQSLIGKVGTSLAPAREAAQTAYATALQALTGRRTQAETLAGQGQTALANYLAANQPRAYSSLPAAQAPTLSPDVVARYASAIGAPTTAIGQTAAQAAVEAQAAAGGYDRLINTLRAAQESGQASRLAELEMLRNVQGAGIQQLYGAGSQQLEAQRQAALTQIAQQQAAQEFALQQAQLARQQALQQALLGVYGTGYANPLNFGG
jgi:hypothetical protein